VRFSRKQQDGSAPNFFKIYKKLQPALKSTAPGL